MTNNRNPSEQEPTMEDYCLDPEKSDDVKFWEKTIPIDDGDPTVDIQNKLFGGRVALKTSLQSRGGVNPDSETYFSDLGETRGD